METTFKCKCDEECLRPLIVRNYDSDRLEFEIDGNAIVLDLEQLNQLTNLLSGLVTLKEMDKEIRKELEK